MAKKSKRAKAKYRARVANRAQEEHSQQLEPLPAEVPSPSRVSPKVQPSKVQDFASRYQYVIPELKRIGIIAGVIIIVIIVLSFVMG